MKKHCIFCNGIKKKSKEHIWPEWMHELLPKLGDGNNVSKVDTFRWKNQIDAKSSKRQGHLSTKKLRVVCSDCNNGWMSVLENEAKPILTKILKNENFTICTKEQNTLVAWITLKSIVGEHNEDNTQVTPPTDCDLFRTTRKTPEYYAMYIGRHNERSDTAWLRASLTLARSQFGPNPPLGDLKRNTQSIAFICGSLFVYVLAIREKEINTSEFLNLPKLIRIFPYCSSKINWPPKQTLDASDMGLAAFALDEMTKMKNVRYGGDLS